MAAFVYFTLHNLANKIQVPQEEHPEHNFMGLILGPRGHYLFKLQEKTDCKIIIKGRGTLKQGMTGIRKDGQRFDGQSQGAARSGNTVC